MNRMDTLSNSLLNDVAALQDRFDGLSTHEDHQELMNRQEHLQQDFEAFRGHFYTYFPAPPPPPEFHPQQPYYPPPPPPEL